MPRTARVAPGGMVFQVLNRDVGRRKLFTKDGDFEVFEGQIKGPIKALSWTNQWGQESLVQNARIKES